MHFTFKCVHPIQVSRAIQGRLLMNEVVVWAVGDYKDSLWIYVGMIAVNPRREDVKIVLVEKTTTWETVPQVGGFWEKNVLRTNGIRIECGWLKSVYLKWRILESEG